MSSFPAGSSPTAHQHGITASLTTASPPGCPSPVSWLFLAVRPAGTDVRVLLQVGFPDVSAFSFQPTSLACRLHAGSRTRTHGADGSVSTRMHTHGTRALSESRTCPGHTAEGSLQPLSWPCAPLTAPAIALHSSVSIETPVSLTGPALCVSLGAAHIRLLPLHAGLRGSSPLLRVCLRLGVNGCAASHSQCTTTICRFTFSRAQASSPVWGCQEHACWECLHTYIHYGRIFPFPLSEYLGAGLTGCMVSVCLRL